jgi:hypothetical protein
MFGITEGDLSAEFDLLTTLVDASGSVTFSLDKAEKARCALWTLSGPN